MKKQSYTVGCVIMASGFSKRFGENKLLTKFCGESLIELILNKTGGTLFEKRVVVTRYREIEKLCREQGIDVIFHEFPHRNDTVRLGMEWIMKENVCDACMFIPSDQPLLTEKSLEKIKVSYRLECDICRLSYEKTAGAPVLFGRAYFEELKYLPEGKGGGYLIKKYPDAVKYVQAERMEELWDVDTKEDLMKCQNSRGRAE